MSDEQSKTGEFRVALWGFKKSDVLAYIDALAAENLQKEAEHTARAEELQASIDALRSDNDTLLTKTKEICQQLTGQERRANEAEAEAQELQVRLTHAQETAEGYKNRMFTQEQELVSLRDTNSRMNAELDEKKVQADQAEQKAEAQEIHCRELEQSLNAEIARAEQAAQQAASKAAEQDTRCRELEQNLCKCTQEAAEKLEAMRVQAAADVREARRQGIDDARNLTEGMRRIREQMTQMESRLTQTMQQLNETADSLYEVLDAAQQSLREMDAHLKAEDAAERVKASWPAAHRPAGRKQPLPHTVSSAPGRTNKRSLADSLLERMARLLLGE